MLDITGPLDVFACASSLRERRGLAPAYRVEIIAARAGPVATSSAIALHANRAARDLDPGDIDTLIVGGNERPVKSLTPALRDFLIDAAAKTRRVASVCTGSFWLAEAGLLEGRRAVTHWGWCAAFAERYPGIAVEPDALFVRDGKFWTSAGVSAGIDLALAVAQAMVVYLKRPGGQSQFSVHLENAPDHAEAPVARTRAHIAADLKGELTVESLAEVAGLSPRHFARVFRRETGLSPAAYIERLRIEGVREALCSSDAPQTQIAERFGFRSADVMRRAFIRALGVAPNDYRARFR